MNSEKEKLLNATYDKFMKVSMNKLPGELLEGITAENIMAYGTAIDERLLSIQDCRDLVERQLEQASGMKFKHERIPVSIRISPEEDSAIFVEELNLTIKSKEVTHRLFLRITTALEYSNNKWKVVHFHTSKPDDTKGETDTWHIDEWKRKNEELQKLVDEKTSDLVIKNRDLEIEASLERVRTIAMGMRKSDDLLNICETLFNELKILGFDELRNTMINIHNDKEKTFINYDYSDTLGKTITPLFYNINPVIAKQVKQIRKGKDAFSETFFKGKELEEWKKFRKRKGEPDDPRIKNAKALYYYFYSIGTGSIGISTFDSVIKEQLELLKRFRNVFEFAYRRYMDVMQAEEQAKEAKIEASLERVRTHSMAMKKPDDLVKVCESLYNELRTLGFMNLRNSQIVVFNDDNKSFLNYDYSDYAGANTTTILNNSHPLIQSFLIKIKKSKEAFAEFSMELKDWKKFRKKNGELPDPKLDKAAFIYYYFYSIGAGAIGISAFASITKEELEILKRFRNVFEFAYGKYSDVSKAEAQTKEAKIEIALERVRSRTMAMQKSEELSETTYILFQQFIDLGETPDQITIGIINEVEKAIEFWTTMDGNKVDMMVKFPVKDSDLMKKIYSAWKKQKKSFVIEIKGKELHDYIDYRIRLTGVSAKNDHVYDRRFVQAAFFSKGMITISTNDPPSKETLQLLERFAGVFDLTYTRFLDLKQAEAQTKEAKIELALERVRARSMAMHSSDELVDSSIVLFNELKSLGIESIRTGVGIFDESKKAVEIWSSQLIEEKRNKILGVVPFNSHPFFELNYNAWKRKEPYFFYEIAGKEVKKYYKVMSSVLSYPEKKEFNPIECFYTFFFPEGSLNVVSNNYLTEDECNLMLRFAKVFGMIYRRFLDLQKAEAQARESQIELALERVRARTMAMQRSDELEETSQILFRQFKELGEAPERITIGTINEPERQIELWVTVEGYQNRMVKVSIDEPNVIHKIYTAWKRQKKSILIDLKGKELRDYIAYRKSFGNDNGIGEFLKDRMIVYVAFFSKGIISITTPELLPRENILLLERFAGVFDLTYTRFLDLQKAEEQAREALIEVALERVRSRTMAMHKSEELAETAAVLFQQLCGLGIDALRLYIGIIDEESDEIEFWTTDYGGSQISSKYKANLYGSTTFRKMYNGWKEKKKSFIVDPKGKELTEHLYYLKEIMNYPIRNRKTLNRRLQTIAYFSKGLIGVLSLNELPKESINLLERFAGVFDLTYRRFLDLQTSEAQTKEAHIEVALERVRSRTMAMHSSDELQEAAILLFQQIKELGVETGSCGYVIWENKNKDATVWMSSAEGGFQESFNLPHTKSKIYKEIYSAKEEGKEFFVKEVSGAELKKHFDYLTTVPGIGEKIKELRKASYKFPETITYNTAFFKQGYLSFHTHELIPEAHDIFRRFAKVFEQTYTRFLDLQKAEAQAREAQIEAALEKVRSRTMGMQKSAELKEVIQVVLEQFVQLNINAEHAGFVMDYKSRDDYNIWVADPLGVPSEITIPYFDSVYYNRFNEAKIKGEDFFALNLTFKEKNIFYKKLFKYIPGLPEESKKFYFRCPGLAASTVLLENICLYIENFSGLSYTDEENATLMRFGKVFQQTYTRFLDLQKAEAQAREAQIEAALERIRSQSMGMQTSKDLSNVTTAMFEQLRMLGGELYASGIVFCDKHKHHVEQWHSVPGSGMLSPFIVPVDLDYIHQYRYDQWKKGVELFSVEIPEDIIAQHFEAMFSLPTVKAVLDDFAAKNIPMPETPRWEIDYGASFKQGYILVSALQPFSNADILPRFAKVFEQTYTRFLDLQKAEDQAREAQIETALERVRSRSLAMQKADELGEVITVVVDKLKELDFSVSDGVALITYSKGSKDLLEWMANPGFPSALKFHVPYFEHPVLANLWKAKNEGKEFIMERYTAEENKSFLNHIFEHSDFKHTPQPIKDYCLAAETYATSIAFQTNTSIFINDYSGKSLSEQEIDILKRFSKVFEQAYVRFLDLQKAEAQAREAQIEAALEKVRGKAMAMHNSNDLTEAAGQVFAELNNLGIKPIRSGFVLLTKESRKAKLYPATSFDNKNTISFTGEFEFTGHPVYEKQYESWKKKENYFPVLKGEVLKSYYKILAKGLSVPYENFLTKNKEQFGTFLPFKEGFLFTWSDGPYSETEINILDRFKAILDLTIRRYLDLQKAEAQTREAQIEAGLERVRSRAMAMHKTDELLNAAELVYKELSTLGITSMNVSYSFLDKEEKYASYYSVNPVDGKTVPFPFVFPHTETEVMRSILSSWKKQESFNVIGLDEKATLEHQTWAGEHIQTQITKNNINIPFSLEAFLAISPKTAVIYTFNFSKGYLFVIGEELLTKMQEDLLLRFTKVFEQAYIRFLDLQKAEAQAREARIEAAMERTRTQSMIMQHSNELDDTLRVFHEQVLLLGIKSEFSFLWLPDEEKDRHIFWVTWLENGNDSTFFKSKAINYPLDRNEPATAQCMVDWKSDEAVHSYNIPPAGVKNYFAAWSELFEGAEQLQPKYFKNGLYYVEAFMKYGCFGVMIKNELSGDEKKILLRFAIEFERTYTRFLDLQKAEAQTREAQIEASLERVRSKTMAMHNSKDVGETVSVMFDELIKLGIETYRCGIGILDEAKEMEVWTAKPDDKGKVELIVGYLDMSMHPLLKGAYHNWKNNEDSYYYHLKGKDLTNYFNAINKHEKYPVKYDFDSLPGEIFHHDYYFREGTLFVFTLKNLSAEDESTLKRFAGVFGQTYRRYLDLKKAEAQSRESQIEASLERVRSKAMAMQMSDDLGMAVATIFEELDKLDLGALRCGIGIIDKAKKSVDVWATAISDGKKTVQVSGDESMDTHPLLQGAYDAWLKQEDFSYLLQGDDLKKYYEVQIESNFKLPESQSIQNDTEGLKQYYYVAVFQSGGLFAFRETPFPEEAITVIKRFADVINFTYTRFNDLKQAEAQAKEAKIEAALERVRAGSLIMRKPEDMFDVCKVISEQLKFLNVNEIRNTQTVILNESKETYQNYEYFPDYNEKTFSEIDYNLHPKVTEFVNEIKKSSEAFFTTSFEGNELQEWREYRKNTNQIPDAKLDSAHSVHYYFYSIGPGALGISTYAPLSEEEISIFKRFRNVFELAYRRYIDIEQAEAQAREAQIEAALERVRSRTLAMQKSDELAETAAVVFKQLINLGIEPNRLYIGIINDDSGNIEAWATDEDGSKVSKEFTLNINANASVKKMYDGWAEKKKSIFIDMHGEELESYLHYIGDVLHVPFKGGLSQDRRVQNIAYFSKGFIGMASPDPQPEETAVLLERFAAVFNLTFTRFNDLQIAEKHAEQAQLDLIKLQTEKKRAEEALSELRATQAQLIQSEKMASLGELTAGIAHEIQNPLNFVNNFSEVNTELIDELNQEIVKGNFEEAVLIAKDIKENEEKIKHHGKRAEGIVKGMLQHSRSSSGVKEPVNINTLADEYLRLAYHGLRAKDKTFNAKMETDFDESIGKINVIPQDIGRVILNLITNAFYSVDEKKKLLMINGYEPTVTVITKRENNNALITVKDNGNGIPQKVLDKIFQPFFTTKPTGLGTGLGLSMSYDIIKAHGGELKVETKEGEGADFIIVLPLAENK